MRIERKLHKSDIFELTDDIAIFSKYLNIPESDIIECIETGRLMNSPVRDDDTNNSAGFKYNNKGKLKLRDFGGYFWGDCFDLVAFELGLNVNNRHHFVEILKHIYATITAKNDGKVHVHRVNLDLLKEAKSRKRIIDIETRPWTVYDKHIWNDILYRETDVFGYMEFEGVYPIQHYWIDIHSQPSPKYYYKSHNPAFAYYLGHDINSIANYRIYLPYTKPPYSRFISNNSSWQGLETLDDDYDILVIIKSNKDRISLKSFTRFNKYKIGVIAPPSENHVVSVQEYNWLASRVKGRFANGKPAIISFYDFDYAGLLGSGRLKRTYGVPRFMFTNGKYGTAKTGKKDFTDTIPVYGKTKLYNMTNNYFDKLEIK